MSPDHDGAQDAQENPAQFTGLSTGPEMELSCGQLGVLGRNNCSLD